MNVEIWSDVVCPWCYIGKRRFEEALARFPHRDAVTITWRSFELDPHAPRESQESLDERLARKMRTTPAQAAELNAHVSALAAGDGLEYHLDQAKPGNTFDAHRLIHLAASKGVQDAVTERLMRAYFTDGLPIGDAETLARAVAEVGLEAADARAALASGAYAEDVRADEARAAEFGISGVPFFVLDERFGVSGAQPPDLFLNALQTAWAASRPGAIIREEPGSAGDQIDEDGDTTACEGENCAV
jgi:predicted DsbA family dithiol-disulfide isomerase